MAVTKQTQWESVQKNQQPEKVVVGGGWWCDLSTGLRICGTEIPLLLDHVTTKEESSKKRQMIVKFRLL